MRIILILLFFIFLNVSNSLSYWNESLKNLDSLEKNLNYIKNDTTKIVSLIYLSINGDDLDKRYNYLKQASQMSEKLRWKYGLAFYRIFQYKWMIDKLVKKSNLSKNEIEREIKSIDGYYFKTEQFIKQLNTGNLLKRLYFERGINHIRINNNVDRSVEYFYKSLSLKMDYSDSINLTNETFLNSIIYEKIGEYYQGFENFKKAIEAFNKGIELSKNYEQLPLPYNILTRHNVTRMLFYLGNLYRFKADYHNAIINFQKSYKLMSNDKAGAGRCLMNIGNIYRNIGNYSTALENYLNALKLYGNLEVPDKASAYLNIGNIYQLQGKLKEALENYNNSLNLIQNTQYKNLESGTYNHIGNVYFLKNDFKKAENYYQKSYKLNLTINNKSGIAGNLSNFGRLAVVRNDMNKAKQYFDSALTLFSELGMKGHIAGAYSNISNMFNESIIKNDENHNVKIKNFINQYKVTIDSVVYYKLKSLEIYKEIGELASQSKTMKELSEIYYNNGKFKESVDILREYEKVNDSIFTIDSKIKISELLVMRENEIKDKEIELKDLQLLRTQNERLLFLFGILFIAVVSFVIYRQRQKSEKLLLNILPQSIAERLKRKEKNIADKIPEASVIFIDMVNFTELSLKYEPEKVVKILNDIFTKFDKIARKYGIEKIKTIGDCYMAAAGVPITRNDHFEAIVFMAVDIMHLMNGYQIALSDLNDDLSNIDKINIHFRIGIDCGTVIAGVIGEQKFIFDLWGDTVNTAARMEQYGEADKIHITENFRNKIESKAEMLNIKIIDRGEIKVKGKGKMNTYFIEKNCEFN